MARRDKMGSRSAGLVMLLAGMLAPVAAAAEAPAPSQFTSGAAYKRVLTKEAGSRALCESRTDRILVSHRLGTECIAFFVTRGHEGDTRAVIFFDGDLRPEKMSDEVQARILSAQQNHLQRLADSTGTRFIAVSRPGILGSSGNHAERRKTAEMLSVNAAVDLLKARLGLDRIGVAGQSGGSTVAAALLTMGRTDIACAVLGSGNLAVVDRHVERAAQEGRKLNREAVARAFYDPLAHVEGIVADAGRRIFVLGDPKDQVTPFALQQRFAGSVRALGHHVEAVPISGMGLENHGSVHRALPAVAQCMAGRPDEFIVARAMQPVPAAPVASAAPPVSSGKAGAAASALPEKTARPEKEELAI